MKNNDTSVERLIMALESIKILVDTHGLDAKDCLNILNICRKALGED